MTDLELYMAQDVAYSSAVSSSHYDVHTDVWADEADEPYGHSGHCDSHTDESNDVD